MEPNEIIKGRRVLIVDDEPDVLDLLAELLDACKIDTASNFEEAAALLGTVPYDAAILDIMGVRGFDLLKIATEQDIPTLMLTAHALSEEALRKSAEGNASSYIPKEKMSEIAVFLADVLESINRGKSPWLKWFERLGSFYDRKFGGKDWRTKEKAFWEKRIKGFMH